MATAQRGDEDAFAALVRAWQDVAVACATQLLGDYHLAEDAAQEAFLEAHRALGALREPAAFGAWFRTIIVKHCDRIRRRKRHPVTGLDDALEAASPEPSPYERLERREARAALHSAVQRLTDAEREVVLLYYMGEQSQAEIAAFLRITANAVKTRLYSARRRLRAHMGEIEKRFDTARPSRDTTFGDRVARLIQPAELGRRAPLEWSSGMGSDLWELFCACIMGDLPAVERLVADDPSLVRAHYEYRTPLAFAVRNNRVAVARFLLEHGADSLIFGDPLQDAHDRGFDEMAALLAQWRARENASTRGEAVAAAIRDRDLPRVRALLDTTPELLHEGDARSNRPIHWAVMTRQPEMIDELLARGADINARRQDGARPLQLTNGDYHYRGWRDVSSGVTATPDDVYRHLVARGAEVDIGMAAAKGDRRRVEELLQHEPTLANRVDAYNSYYVGCGAPLRNAVIGGDIEIVKLLLAHGADPNLPEEGIAPHGHALYSAVTHGQYEIAKLLLEHGANPDAPVESSADAVWIAIRDGKIRMLELLARYGATWEIPLDPPEWLTYEAIVATGIGLSVPVLAAFNDIDRARERFAEDPALADDPGALSQAAGRGHMEFVRLLLEYQPDLARRATVTRPREMALLLFEYGMDPSRPDWLRKTPLHEFAHKGDVESAALFIDHGADLAARDEEFLSTPLAWAARAGQERMVEFLLRRGAAVSLPDDPPWATPLAWATRRGHETIVRLLTAFQETGKLPERELGRFEAQVQALREAWATGSNAAMEQVMGFLPIRRQLTWDKPSRKVRHERFRQELGEHLRREFAFVGGHELPRDVAESLVARVGGFASWEDLLASTTPSKGEHG